MRIKKLLFILMLSIGALSFSNEALDKVIGKWVDDYDVVLEISKNGENYTATSYGDLGNNEKEYSFQNSKIELVEGKYIKIYDETSVYYAYNAKNNTLNTFDPKTKKIIYDPELEKNYEMSKVK